MKPNRARKAAAEGRVAFGHMLMEFDTPGIAKLCALADLDFVLIDMEHGGRSTSRRSRASSPDSRRQARAPSSASPHPSTTSWRGSWTPAHRESWRPTSARRSRRGSLNDAMRYAPEGNRGLGLGTSHNDFVRPDPVDYMSRANRSNMLLCQIESTTALRNLDRIASEPGVDCLWVGHMDPHPVHGNRGPVPSSRLSRRSAGRRGGLQGAWSSGRNPARESGTGKGLDGARVRHDLLQHRHHDLWLGIGVRGRGGP